jgi:hypothetical protein
MSNQIKEQETGMPAALIVWIKKEQIKDSNHREAMIRRSQREDPVLVSLISLVSTQWGSLSRKEKLLITNFIAHFDANKAFTPNQKSVITTLYLKFREMVG